MKKNNFICLEKWPEYNEKKIDENVMTKEDSFMKICEDIKQVIKLSKKNKILYLYVVNEDEYRYLLQSISFLKKELGFSEIKIFKVNDSKKYDPENKSKRAKLGKPGIFIE